MPAMWGASRRRDSPLCFLRQAEPSACTKVRWTEFSIALCDPADGCLPQQQRDLRRQACRRLACGTRLVALLSVALNSIALRALRWSTEGEVSVLVRGAMSDTSLDIGSFQYLSGNEKGLASLQGLDFSSLSGSPTWARTRDLRINRLGSIGPLTRMNARFSGFAFPILLGRFAQQTHRMCPNRPLDIGSIHGPVSHLSR